MRHLLFFLLSALACWQCTRDTQPGLIRAQLEPPRQTFDIATGRDTSITCAGGTVLRFCANTFKTIAPSVTLEIREVLTRADMVGAGISTRSTDGRLLESAGMIYLNATEPAGVGINPDCPVEIQLPTQSRQADMGLFKGVENNGTVEWLLITDPKASSFLNQPDTAIVRTGKELFEINCAACHCCDLANNLTGPPLGNITRYRDAQWLRDFTRSSQDLIEQGDTLATCLWERWKPVAMPDFKSLSDKDIDAIYTWIEQESGRLAVSLDAADYVCNMDTGHQAADDTTVDSVPNSLPALAAPIRNPRLDSYMFRAYEFGWYNCDVFLQETTEAELSVTVKEAERYDDLIVSLLYERRKVNLPLGSIFEGSPEACFAFNEDKRCILAYEAARIVALALRDDKWYSAEHPLVIGAKNEVSLSLQSIDKKDVEAVLKKDIKTIRENVARQDSILNRERSGCPCTPPPLPSQ